ncbi:MAG TPA: permease prefix domain 1-containing protein, partial [Bryobacteraceae bacterium]|nr:permease prefix domain 1-containing protein [Bryobacteraceae bacterium]
MSWFSRLRNAFHSKRLDGEIAEEIEDHLARRADELAARGMDEAEAREKAVIRFGNRTHVSEMTREARLWSTVESFGADVRYAWRGMHKSWGFT